MKFMARYRKQIWTFSGLLVVDGLVFSLTNADKVPSFMLVASFLLLIVTFYYLAHGLLTFAKVYGLSITRKRRVSAFAAGLVGGLVALQSIGQLNQRDILVLLPLLIVGYAYSFYGKATQRTLQP